jgi:hypothetical protein
MAWQAAEAWIFFGVQVEVPSGSGDVVVERHVIRHFY